MYLQLEGACACATRLCRIHNAAMPGGTIAPIHNRADPSVS